METLPVLLPVPRSIERGPGVLSLRGPVPVGTSGPEEALERAVERLHRSLRERVGLETGAGGTPVSVRLDPSLTLAPEGYLLEISPGGVELRARDARGLLHAAGTLDQLLAGAGRELPALRVRDWPDFSVRGFMLDVSRDRVPTLETLLWLADRMADWKLNELQLYVEHTFAYSGHEEAWRHASPLTLEEIRTLDAHCARRGIELVPNQQAFGHMERWLRHPRYRHLAECPDAEAPACLAPTPEGVEFARGLLAEHVAAFSSRRVHIGCDETFELGRGRSREACEERGRDRVYLDFLRAVAEPLLAQGREVLFWGDIVSLYPERVPDLPAGLTPLAWGYEAPCEPEQVPARVREMLARYGQPPETLRGFGVRVDPFVRAGVPFQVCPGTSSWNSLVGRWPNARDNLRDAARAGLAAGAHGALLTDWGDNGHLQPLAVSLPPLALGAALAWCADSAESLELERALGALAYPDARAARAALRLGSVYAETGLRAFNASPLGLALLRPLDAALPVWGETSRATLEAVVRAIEGERDALSGDDALTAELRQAAGLARHGAWRLLRRHGGGPDDAALRRDLDALVAEQRRTWLCRSRPGGLADSLARLTRLRGEYSSE